MRGKRERERGMDNMMEGKVSSETEISCVLDSKISDCD